MTYDAGPDVRLRTQLSNLEGLLVVFMLMTESPDEDRILQLSTTSIRSLSGCMLVGVYLLGEGWKALSPDLSEGRPEQLEDEVLALGSPGGPLDVDKEDWKWAYPLRTENGHVGFFVVENDVEPSSEELLLVRLLAWGTGAALSNQRRHQQVRATAEKLASLNENLEQRFSRGFHHSPIGMALVGVDGGFIQVNAALCEMLGRTEAELLATDIQSVTYAEERDEDERVMEQMIAGDLEAHNRERRYVKPDGSVVWGMLGTSLIRDIAGQPMFFSQIQDITERKHAEERLLVAYENELKTAARLRELDQLKDEFLAIVSHELRTPLTPIQGLAEALVNNYDHFDDAAKRDLLERIRYNAHEMARMIRGLLDFSRLQAGRIQLEPRRVKLIDTLQKCVASLDEVIGQRNVSLSVDDGVEVEADVEALERIMVNLLTNAAKFSMPGMPIEVRADANDDRVIVRVADRGPGIPLKDQERIFDRFWQGREQPSGKRGSGLGLAIAKRYVELSGGHIWVDSKSGEGSVFSFTLPKGGSTVTVGDISPGAN